MYCKQHKIAKFYKMIPLKQRKIAVKVNKSQCLLKQRSREDNTGHARKSVCEKYELKSEKRKVNLWMI